MNINRMSLFIAASVVIFFQLGAQSIKPKLGEPPVKSTPYLFIDDKTPAYIMKSAIEKKINFAMYLQSSDAGWIRKNINTIGRGSLLIFVKSPTSELEKGYLDELAKISEYKVTLVCFSGSCKKEADWTHPLIKNNYTIEWKKGKNGEEIFMKKGKLVSKGSMLSATDMKDFRENPTVNGAVSFKETGFSFVSLDEEITKKTSADVWITVYYSKSEKKIKEFVEKKI